MSITGGVKFFEPSQNLLVNGATITASTGSSSASYCIDRNPLTYWRSVASSDLITETLDIVFPKKVSINRLFLLDHNFKQFSIQYNNNGVMTDFTNVVGLSGSIVGALSETAFSKDTGYFEFDSVTTSEIKISVTKTQIANSDKYLSQVIATSEIGTFVGFPTVKQFDSDRNSRSAKTSSGRYSVQKSNESFACQLAFKDYPSAAAYNADIDLVMSLQDRDIPFITWLCGGRSGSSYFRYTLRGFRLRDAITMQMDKPLSGSYSQSIYTGHLNLNVSLQEHI